MSRECTSPCWTPEPQLWRALAAACESAWPLEGCGVLVGRDGVAERAIPLPNALDASLGRERFEIRVDSLVPVLLEAERRGDKVVAFFHSHVDAPACWSPEDDRAARGPDGQPLWPGVEQIVVEVKAGRAVRAARYAWHGAGWAAR